ncbi:hypothetical protein MTR67_039051 [Solanum verrucosum]|uniref:Retrotransposon gag domain-containing protein n=1 Tax=Solanum verrucosum TaxID=315347 RepID=A0AAF0UHD0_SOLVR|nr:hypothetical protein MTR67_039051 [Solanum verrucosum]
MLHRLQMKGLFGGLAHEDPHDHIQNFVDAKQRSGWSIYQGNQSTSLEELTDVFYVRFFLPSKMVKLRDNIQNFKRVDGEPIHETWLRFQKLLLQCLTHGLPDNVLLQYFYRSLDLVNKGLADQLIQGGIMQQSFDIVSTLLNEMTKNNHAWYTRDDQVSPLNFGMMKEQMEKNQERDENMAKMMTQMDLLTKYVMGSGSKSVNAVGVSGVNLDEAHFESMYNEKVHFLANQTGGFRPNYPRPDENQSWNRDRGDGWRGRDRNWRDRGRIGGSGMATKNDMCLPMSIKSQKSQGLILKFFAPKICLLVY